MKKIIYIILVLILATLCFASCQETSDFDKLNEMAYADHSQVSIGITVKKSGETQSLVHNIVNIIIIYFAIRIFCLSKLVQEQIPIALQIKRVQYLLYQRIERITIELWTHLLHMENN